MPNFDWPRPVVHFQIHARDKQKQEAFYREMFDWDITQREGTPISTIPPGKGPPVEGIGGSVIETGRPAVTVYIQVPTWASRSRRRRSSAARPPCRPSMCPTAPPSPRSRTPKGT